MILIIWLRFGLSYHSLNLITCYQKQTIVRYTNLESIMSDNRKNYKCGIYYRQLSFGNRYIFVLQWISMTQLLRLILSVVKEKNNSSDCTIATHSLQQIWYPVKQTQQIMLQNVNIVRHRWINTDIETAIQIITWRNNNN